MCFLFLLNNAQSAYSSACLCAPGLGIEITLKKMLLQAAVGEIDEHGKALKASAAVCWGSFPRRIGGIEGRKPNSHLNVYTAKAQTEWGGVVGLVQTAEEMKDVAAFQIVLWPSQALCEIQAASRKSGSPLPTSRSTKHKHGSLWSHGV